MKSELPSAQSDIAASRSAQPETSNAGSAGHSVTIREPSDREAEEIAQLFQLVYRESSHPCKNAGYVRAALHSGNDFWRESRISATAKLLETAQQSNVYLI